ARGVVAHGAPYVTSTKAGRSQGCPAVAQGRAQTLRTQLAAGGMVFLFAPDAKWLANDPWVNAAAEERHGKPEKQKQKAKARKQNQKADPPPLRGIRMTMRPGSTETTLMLSRAGRILRER